MKPISAMNVIPFIDVMLVLLAIVLTTATFVAQGRIPVDLPSARHADPVEDLQAVDVIVSADGTIFVADQVQSLERFVQTLHGLPVDVPLVLKVDEQAAFRHFVAVAERIKQAELRNVSIATQQDPR